MEGSGTIRKRSEVADVEGITSKRYSLVVFLNDLATIGAMILFISTNTLIIYLKLCD